MFRLATIGVSCLLGVLCVGASGQAAPPELKKTVITIEICKTAKSGEKCGPSLETQAPRVGHVTAQRPKINCPQDCVAMFSGRARVTMAAIPIPGHYRFVRWGGLCKGEPNLCEKTVQPNAKVHVQAYFTFSKKPYP